jgi:Putative zinc-finger
LNGIDTYMNQIIDRTNDHDAIWLLLPWYVNGRLDEQQRARVDAHLRACEACQQELLMQRKICQAMSVRHADIEQLPTASLRRLLQKIDAHENPADIEMPDPATNTRQAPSWRWSRSLAASLAVVAVAAMGFVAVNRFGLVRKELPADYYTVTSPAPRVPLEVIRVVFAPAITVADMQHILNDSQLDIVAGPTQAGVYSLAKAGTQPVSDSLQRLRSHKEVLFAEPTATTEAAASK